VAVGKKVLETRSGSDGRFDFDALPGARYTVQAVADGFRPLDALPLELIASEDRRDYELRLNLEIRIDGQVTKAPGEPASAATVEARQNGVAVGPRLEQRERAIPVDQSHSRPIRNRGRARHYVGARAGRIVYADAARSTGDAGLRLADPAIGAGRLSTTAERLRLGREPDLDSRLPGDRGLVRRHRQLTGRRRRSNPDSHARPPRLLSAPTVLPFERPEILFNRRRLIQE